ncbi:MAG: hypothetical protein ACPLZD_06055 [Candidatus Saccharicenans sp.]|nr:MAG: hypothetical protein C0168_03370 [Candidatus Aminicenantes bacterium]HEK85418.1 hypothetical protein [Candidatus Aminicenantes bacterium]
MPRAKVANLTGLPFLIFLFSLFKPVLPIESPGQFWQLCFRLQVEGTYKITSENIEGCYRLDLEWLGFLEGDGLDFIIYHLGVYPYVWELREKTPRGLLTINSLGQHKANEVYPFLPPELKLEYIQGSEKEIIFYFYLKSLPVPIDQKAERPGGFLLIFPSIPWKEKLNGEVSLNRKIIGQKIISIPRSRLKSDEFKENFSWAEEITPKYSTVVPFYQEHQVKVDIRFIKADLNP